MERLTYDQLLSYYLSDKTVPLEYKEQVLPHILDIYVLIDYQMRKIHQLSKRTLEVISANKEWDNRIDRDKLIVKVTSTLEELFRTFKAVWDSKFVELESQIQSEQEEGLQESVILPSSKKWKQTEVDLELKYHVTPAETQHTIKAFIQMEKSQNIRNLELDDNNDHVVANDPGDRRDEDVDLLLIRLWLTASTRGNLTRGKSFLCSKSLSRHLSS